MPSSIQKMMSEPAPLDRAERPLVKSLDKIAAKIELR